MSCPEAFTFLGLNGCSAQTPEGDKEGGESKEGGWGWGARGSSARGLRAGGVRAWFYCENSGRKRKGALEKKVVWKMA